MNRRWIGVLTFSALLVGSAQAADLRVKAPVYKVPPPPAPVYTWSGFYVGAHAGYLWSSAQVLDTGIVVEPNAHTNGFVGGVLAGYNYQLGQIVLGLEGDWGWSNAHGTGTTAAPATTPANQYDLDWTAHARGRLGIAPTPAPFLLFIAGGLAVSQFTFTDGETGDKMSATYTGGSIGGGGEFAFTPNVIGRVEYLYDDYRMSSSAVVLHDYTAKLQNASTVRGALSIKLN